MFTVADIVLLVLKIAHAIMGEVHDDKAVQAGTDAEIARVSAAILRKTKAGKEIMEKVDAMSDKDVDAGLRGLEP